MLCGERKMEEIGGGNVLCGEERIEARSAKRVKGEDGVCCVEMGRWRNNIRAKRMG